MQSGGKGIIGGGDSATAAAKWDMEGEFARPLVFFCKCSQVVSCSLKSNTRVLRVVILVDCPLLRKVTWDPGDVTFVSTGGGASLELLEGKVSAQQTAKSNKSIPASVLLYLVSFVRVPVFDFAVRETPVFKIQEQVVLELDTGRRFLERDAGTS